MVLVDWIHRLKDSLGKTHSVPRSESARISSVLMCLGEINGVWQIVLTKRTQFVQTHKGQVSFPGGVQESHDATLLHTALRESEEEIGIHPEHPQVMGVLPPVDTIGRVRIFPWVATLMLPYPFRLSTDEVEKVIFLPVQELMEKGLQPVRVRVDGIDVKSEGIYADGELVWGATAKILSDFRAKALELRAVS